MKRKGADLPTETVGVLASGRGSNFQAILDHIELGVLDRVEVGVLVSDNPDANALQIAEEYGIPHRIIEPEEDEEKQDYERRIHAALEEHEVSLVALAGYMRIVSPYLLDQYENRMMNVHPALLPAFKGLNAQKQALEYGVKVSGCTIHYAWKEVDSGPIILQQAVPVKEEDTEETLSQRILIHEHRLYSKAIQLHADGRLTIEGRKVKTDYGDNWEEKWGERQEAFIEHQRETWKGSEVFGDVFE